MNGIGARGTGGKGVPELTRGVPHGRPERRGISRPPCAWSPAPLPYPVIPPGRGRPAHAGETAPARLGKRAARGGGKSAHVRNRRISGPPRRGRAGRAGAAGRGNGGGD